MSDTITFPTRKLIDEELLTVLAEFPAVRAAFLDILDSVAVALDVVRPWGILNATCKPFGEFDDAERAGLLASMKEMSDAPLRLSELRHVMAGPFAASKLPRTMAQIDAFAEEVDRLLDAATTFTGIARLPDTPPRPE
jgi:hypothetical protein